MPQIIGIEADGSPARLKSINGILQVRTAGDDPLKGVVYVVQGPWDVERCAAGVATTLGNTGAVGDILHALRIESGATSVVVKDGATTRYTWTVGSGEPRMQTFDWVSTEGAWEVTSTAGVAVADGIFTP